LASAQEVAIVLKAKDDASANIAKVSTSMGTLSKDMEQTSITAGKTSKSMQALSQVIAVGFVGAGAAVAGGLAVAARSAMEFEHTLSGVKAVSGATGEQMAALSALSLQLGKDTVYSASQAAGAIEELVKGGVEIPDIMNGAAAATLNLASAGGVELGKAAEIAANAMNQFGLSGKDMAHVADLVSGAANASSIDVGDFAFSLQQVGAVAHLSGQSIDSTAQAIAVMGAAGIKGSDAGTSLKTMLMNLQPTTKSQVAAMLELGIVTADGSNKFIDATGKFKSMRDIAEILNQSTKDLTETEKLFQLETIFGSDAVRAAAIVTEAGAKGFDKMAESMGKVSAESVAAERLNNLAGDLEQLKGSADTAAIMLGQTFTGALRDVAQTANEKLGIVIDRIGEIQESSQNLQRENGLSAFDAEVVATSQVIEREFGADAAKKFNGVITGLSDLKDGIGAAGQFAADNQEPIRDLSVAIGALLIANEAATAVAALKVELAFLATGGGIMGAAIAAAAFVLAPVPEMLERGDKGAQALGASFSALGTTATNAINGVASAVRTVLGLIGNLLDSLSRIPKGPIGPQIPAGSGAFTDPALRNLYQNGPQLPAGGAPGGAPDTKTLPIPAGLQGKQIGTDLSAGIGQGFADQTPATTDQVLSSLDQLLDGVQTHEGIASPAKRWALMVGAPQVAGVAQAWQAGTPALVSAATGALTEMAQQSGVTAADKIRQVAASLAKEHAVSLAKGHATHFKQQVAAHATEAKTAIDGFMAEAIKNVANNEEAFGKAGALVASDFAKALATNTAASGTTLFAAMDKLINDLRTAGVEDWRALGDDLAGAFHDALILRTDEATATALGKLAEVTAEIAATHTASAGFGRAISDTTGKAQAQQTFGAGAPVALSFVDAMTSDLDKDAIKLHDKLSEFVATLQKNQVPEWEALGTALEEAAFLALTTGSEEDMADFNALLADAGGQLATTLEAAKPKVKTAAEHFWAAVTEVTASDENLQEVRGLRLAGHQQRGRLLRDRLQGCGEQGRQCRAAHDRGGPAQGGARCAGIGQ
jgi:TP901 family phage tail tape measure protein